jgi:hypothetical protein
VRNLVWHVVAVFGSVAGLLVALRGLPLVGCALALAFLALSFTLPRGED